MTRSPGPYGSGSALRQALEDRLKQRALERGEDLARLRRLVAFDRVLARLFAAGAESPWLVKGGFGLELRYRLQARTTKDLDLALAAHGPISGEATRVRDALQAALEVDVGDDFVVTVGAPVHHLQGPPEGGVRFPVEIRLAGREFTSFHVDVAASDPEIEPPDWIVGEEYLSFAAIPAARSAVIPLAQQFAEKLHAWTRPRARPPNTRVKDLADLVLIVESGGLDPRRVAASTRTTFERYGTHPIPDEAPAAPAEWREPYEALARELALGARTIEDAQSTIARFWSLVVARPPE